MTIHPDNTPREASSLANHELFQSLALPPSTQTLPSRIQAPSGRIWEIPFTIDHREPFDPWQEMLQMFPQEKGAIRAACEFALKYAPAQLHDFISSLQVFQSGWQLQAGLSAVAGTDTDTPQYKKQTPVESHEKAPRDIDIPSISDTNWAYKRHFSPGHGIGYPLTDEQRIAASHAEASSDVSSILSYISRYKTLAQRYDSTSLRDAVFFGSFRDPYKTCMQICIMDIKLPLHFVALIHYGLGFHFLSENGLGGWSDRSAALAIFSPEGRLQRKAAFGAGDRLFSELVKLYVEDFG